MSRYVAIPREEMPILLERPVRASRSRIRGPIDPLHLRWGAYCAFGAGFVLLLGLIEAVL